MNAQSPIKLDDEEQQYLELTKEYRNWDEMMFKAHRLKYQLDDRNKRRSLKVVSRKARGEVSPLYPSDSLSVNAGVSGGGFKIHLE